MDTAVVLHLARLARLELTGSEVERMARDLTQLLQDIALLKDADASADGPGGTPWTPRQAAEGPAIPDPLAAPVSSLAPEWQDGFFTVPHSGSGIRDGDGA